MNYRKMLEALAAYAKSDRAPELREVVQKLVDEEKARRKRTAARLRHERKQHREYAESTYGGWYPGDVKFRRKAVQEARQ